jgi:hypothetical protein
MNSFPPNFAQQVYDKHKQHVDAKKEHDKAEIRSQIQQALIEDGIYQAPFRNVTDLHKEVIKELTDMKIEVFTGMYHSGGTCWETLSESEKDKGKLSSYLIGCKVSFKN